MSGSHDSNRNAPPADLIEMKHNGFRLGILPGLGASLTHLVWTPPGGSPEKGGINLMRHASVADMKSGNPSRLASFAMVPFTNRIEAGKIAFRDGNGAAHCAQVPVNRPAQNVAIHGFGRFALWSVIDSAPDRIRLGQSFREAGNPYVYEAEQIFTLQRDHVVCELSVSNRGSMALPFGIGFHPWFDRTPDAVLAFSASYAFRMDTRDMPVEAISASVISGNSAGSLSHQFVVAARTPFDTPVSGWGGTATIAWPEWNAALDITASGALRLVHIFSPPEPSVFCVEPVSHLPDVVNRRHLAEHGDMTLLAPGQSMTGCMRLTPRVTGLHQRQ